MTTAQIPDWRVSAPAGVPLARIIPPTPPPVEASAALTPQVLPPAPPTSVGHPASGMPMDRILRRTSVERWRSLLARQYTPDRIEWILRNALVGDHLYQWELFDIMEDTWPRLSKNLGQIKRSVQSLKWEVLAAQEDDEPPSDDAKRRAKVVQTALFGMRPAADEDSSDWRAMVFDLMDAWGKGTSVQEIEWEVRQSPSLGAVIAPKCTYWIHPSHYAWGIDGRLGLRLNESSSDGAHLVPVPDNKFVIGVAKQKTGLPNGAALLRPLAFWWCAANFTAEWFLNFAQLYGVPIRWATYDPSIPGIDAKLAAMLDQMGSSGWGAFPAGTNLEIKEPSHGGSDSPHVNLLERADKNCDLLILGQTLTSDVGSGGSGSRALGQVHADVQEEIVLSAGKWAASVIANQLVRSVVLLNFSNDDNLPTVVVSPDTEEDAAQNATRDKILLDAGVPLPREWFYKRHDIPIPEDPDDVLEVNKPTAPGLPGMPGAGGQKTEDSKQKPGQAPGADPEAPDLAKAKAPSCGCAIHAKESSAQQKLADHVLENLTGVEARWLGGARPWLKKLVQAAESEHVTDAEFVAIIETAAKRIPFELAPLLNPKAVADALEAAMGAAVVNGAVHGYLKRKGEPADQSPVVASSAGDDQPRVPAGSPDGGQWTSAGSALGTKIKVSITRSPKPYLGEVTGPDPQYKEAVTFHTLTRHSASYHSAEITHSGIYKVPPGAQVGTRRIDTGFVHVKPDGSAEEITREETHRRIGA